MPDEEIVFHYTAADIPDVPDGMFAAKLVRIEDGPEGQYGPSWRWTFELSGGELGDETLELDMLTSQRYGSEKAKATQIVTALLGETPEDLRASTLRGKQCRALVEHKENGWPTISKLLPRRAGRSAVASE